MDRNGPEDILTRTFALASSLFEALSLDWTCACGSCSRCYQERMWMTEFQTLEKKIDGFKAKDYEAEQCAEQIMKAVDAHMDRGKHDSNPLLGFMVVVIAIAIGVMAGALFL